MESDHRVGAPAPDSQVGSIMCSGSAIPGGLTTARARQLLADVGPNRLTPGDARPSFIVWLLRAFADPMVLLLLVAGTTYFALGDAFDAVIVLVAVVPIVTVGLLLEARAERALEQLKQLTAPTATVWRDGQSAVIAAEEIVPSDLVA